MDNELRAVPIDVPHSAFLDSSKYDHLELALCAYGNEVEELIPKFRERGMTFKTLSTLSDDDLEILGVRDAGTRNWMLRNFGQCNRMVHTFDKMIQGVDVTKYNDDILLGVSSHTHSMSQLLRAAKLKMDLTEARAVVGNNQYVSGTLKCLTQMEVNLGEMETLLREMEEESEEVGTRLPMAFLVVTSLLGVCVSALVTIRLVA